MTEILTGIGSFLTPISSIFGSVRDFDQPQQAEATPTGFRGTITTPSFEFGGGTLSRTDTGVTDEESALRSRLIGAEEGLGSLFGPNLGSIEEQIAASESRLGGLGDLAAAAQSFIEGRKGEAVGTAREALARRGVLGSSFGLDAISRISAEFDLQAQQARGEATQIELAERARLVGLRFGLAETQAQQFAQQLAAIRERTNLLSLQIQRELGELGIATIFLSQVDQLVNETATGAALAQATTSNAPIDLTLPSESDENEEEFELMDPDEESSFAGPSPDFA